MSVELIAISDTHLRHERLGKLHADLLVHAGDFTRHGTEAETQQFLDWFGAQEAKARVLIAGNHDFFAESSPDRMRELSLARGIHYLEDQATVLLGLKFWGSPITPRFRDMAFNRDEGAPIRAHWDRIPDDVDVLITHGPPRGLGDRALLGGHVGSSDLLEAIRRVRPQVHLFGHIHEGAGAFSLPGLETRFFNVASSRLLGGTRAPREITLR